jgi:hypothetical protein
LLLGVANKVNVVEPVKKLTDELVQSLGNGEYTGDGVSNDGKTEVGDVINLGLQDWILESGAYNVTWLGPSDGRTTGCLPVAVQGGTETTKGRGRGQSGTYYRQSEPVDGHHAQGHI